MTQEQFDRWKDFALRMARTYPAVTDDVRKRAVEEIEELLCEGTSIFVERFRIKSWDETNDPLLDLAYADVPTQQRPRTTIGPFVCDIVSQHLSDAAYRERVPDGEDAYDAWEESGWRVALKCSLRAGLDMAASASAGVVGFTCGDIKRMYPEGIPDWLDRFEVAEGEVKRISAEPDDTPIWL